MADKKARLSLPSQYNVGKSPLRHTQSHIGKKPAPRVPPIKEESTDSSEIVLRLTKETKRRESSASTSEVKPKIDGSNFERKLSKTELKSTIEEHDDIKLSKSKTGSRSSLKVHAYDNEALEMGSGNIFSRGQSERSSMNPSINTVHKEQYCFCSKWSTCQRAAAVTISILVIIIIVLIVVIVVMANNKPGALESLKSFRLTD
ncbi:unnamed protein product [Brassicogethes aeneus]|uniref:Uncharacterized protein n=1 Tax=Brassicogethes aeneus TaxID=1431903 RepID=A0A9P0ATD4_BRAAE|nr:unnamed protein product [Brassicogethes aeneus]